jgi:hypothetical protein
MTKGTKQLDPGAVLRKYESCIIIGLAPLWFCNQSGILLDLTYYALSITSQYRFLHLYYQVEASPV